MKGFAIKLKGVIVDIDLCEEALIMKYARWISDPVYGYELVEIELYENKN